MAVRAPHLLALLALALCAACAALGAVAAAPARAAFVCDPGGDDFGPDTLGDIDGDDTSDRVVGLPNRNEIAVRGSASGAHVYTPASFGLTGGGGSFGAALAIGDVNGDGCADLVIGAPKRGGSGAVYIVRGSPTGLEPDSITELIPPDSAAGDRVGAAVALAQRPGTGGFHDLWVGVPGRDNGVKDAGVVDHYGINPNGSVGTAEQLGWDGTASTEQKEGDRFGEALAPAQFGVVVGVPHKDVGKRKDAGMIAKMRLSETDGGFVGAKGYTQNSAGVPDKAEAGDRFGASVATDTSGQDAIAGAPGEDLKHKKRNAGLAQIFNMRANGLLKPGRAITQDSKGIPRKARRGNRFGAAVTRGRALNCQEADSVAIGAPGDDIGKKARDAGTATIVDVAVEVCKTKVVWQGHGLRGKARKGDGLGSALAIRRGRDDFDEDITDTLLIGVPGDDFGQKKNAGSVDERNGGGPGPPFGTSFGYPGGPHAKARFGSVFALPETGSAL